MKRKNWLAIGLALSFGIGMGTAQEDLQEIKEHANKETEIVDLLREYLDTAPDVPKKEELRQEYADTAAQLAVKLAEQGRFQSSLILVQRILANDVAPNHERARQLWSDLNDPEIYGATPKMMEGVRKQNAISALAIGQWERGNVEIAIEKAFEALHQNPKDAAALQVLRELGFESQGFDFGAYLDGRLSHAQIQLEKGDFAEAIRTLNSIPPSLLTENAKAKQLRAELNDPTTYPIRSLPKPPSAEDLITRVFRVPPTFGSPPSQTEANDPFATPNVKTEAEEPPLKTRPSAKEVLSDAGVGFPKGSSAIYNPSTSQLIVRNTQPNLELVAAYVDALTEIPRQVYLTTKVITFQNSKSLEESEFTWLMEATPLDTDEKKKRKNRLAPIFGAKPNSSTMPEVAGVFTDPQFQIILRALNQQKAVDLLSLPSVLTRSNQLAEVQVPEFFPHKIQMVPTVGADGYTIDMQFRLVSDKDEPQVEEAKFSSIVTQAVTIWDGQTIAIRIPPEKGKKERQLLFITGRMIDPAGQPINQAEDVRKQAESAHLPGMPGSPAN